MNECLQNNTPNCSSKYRVADKQLFCNGVLIAKLRKNVFCIQEHKEGDFLMDSFGDCFIIPSVSTEATNTESVTKATDTVGGTKATGTETTDTVDGTESDTKTTDTVDGTKATDTESGTETNNIELEKENRMIFLFGILGPPSIFTIISDRIVVADKYNRIWIVNFSGKIENFLFPTVPVTSENISELASSAL